MMKMRMLRLLGIGFCVISLLWPQMTFSQEACDGVKEKKSEEKKAEAIKLEDMFVHAFYGEAITITPTKTIIDVDEYVKSGACERIEDILVNIAGIDVMRNSVGPDSQQVMMMRGFNDRRYVTAIDGRPITAPPGGTATPVDWSSLTTGDIAKIEVIRGGASALYENSQGGVINLITKKGKKRETLMPKITLQSDYSSYDTLSERITVDGGVGDLGYFFYYGYNESDGYLRNDCSRINNYSGRLTYLFPFQGNLTLSYKGSDLDMEYPVVNDPIRPDYDHNYPTVREGTDTLRKYRNISYPGGKSYRERRTDHYDIIFEQPIKDTSLKLHLFQTRGVEDSWSYELSGDKLVQKYSGGAGRDEVTRGGSLQYRLDLWENNSLTLGYDHRRMEIRKIGDNYRIQAGYFENIWAITPKLVLNLGLRYSHTREVSWPYADPGTTEKYRHKIKHDVWLPKFTLSYKFRPQTEAYLSINRDYHVPGC